MSLFKKNPFGQFLFLKRIIISVFGIISYRRYNGFNKLQIEGSEILKELPDKNVLFISNHQTYFADVAAMYHVFFATLNGRDNTLKRWTYLLHPKLNLYYIAALETMKAGLLPKIFAYVGSISIERTWRAAGKDVNRQVKMSDITNIKKALDDGWVITFPQGTTKPFNPVRRGTAHLIKTYQPIVVPIVIDGFRRSFDKKGLLIKKRGILQSMVIKQPLQIDYETEDVNDILKKIEYAIEQHPSFLKVISIEEYAEQERKLNKQREFWSSETEVE
ncbi:1-acyl-sn-glycerol-3-phosphate acyltransferase [Wenyingzhuangia sp. 2_MG-2023]|uniref:lysophospholipid acyltransferase family protein n=1 Tax=Wenyingzhuangia sp. 2_MG-2023 TaxID=3062639 RepID=UPI0026E42A82|nr:lysophospholipid acyltransferase family protein [Wenyingzhuangia sp. 2_MG-2023]MDO6736932.1 lysophospholipid acyltransferase family protein [Wenyingzhuangia sp. 2_MG-2023]MDO6801898.1 lysophospholipid acyltransferase family protein [Wenyingzhuangia sp. 1_MG-2023]